MTPSHQFPLGVYLSLPRRAAFLEFARANGAVVIEDDYDGRVPVRGLAARRSEDARRRGERVLHRHVLEAPVSGVAAGLRHRAAVGAARARKREAAHRLECAARRAGGSLGLHCRRSSHPPRPQDAPDLQRAARHPADALERFCGRNLESSASAPACISRRRNRRIRFRRRHVCSAEEAEASTLSTCAQIAAAVDKVRVG